MAPNANSYQVLGYLRAVDVTLSNFGKLGNANTFLLWYDAAGTVKFVNGRWAEPNDLCVGVYDAFRMRDENTAFKLVVADLFGRRALFDVIVIAENIGTPTVSISNVVGDCYRDLLYIDAGVYSLRDVYAHVRTSGGQLIWDRDGGVEAVSVENACCWPGKTRSCILSAP